MGCHSRRQPIKKARGGHLRVSSARSPSVPDWGRGGTGKGRGGNRLIVNVDLIFHSPVPLSIRYYLILSSASFLETETPRRLSRIT